MHESLRLIHLTLLARLRAAGWIPWLLVAGWMVIAAYQEPLLFRGYGIFLVDDAAWTGGLLLLVSVLFAVRRQPRRAAIRGNLLVVAGVAILQSLGSVLADQSSRGLPASHHLASAGSFLLAWAPLAIALGRNSGPQAEERGFRTVHTIVVLTAGLMGSMLAVALRTSPNQLVFGACALAIAGAGCWASGRDHT